MNSAILTDFAGRLHPVLVHLPIGILVLGVLSQLICGVKRFAFLSSAIPFMMFWGMVTTVCSVVTGLVLSAGGEYEEELINPHKWSGVALAAASVLLFTLHYRKMGTVLIKIQSVIILVLVTVTGHLGGSITHGQDYLTASFSDKNTSLALKPIPDIEQAVLFTDVVNPLFQSRCASCHGERKQKGKLRLDEPSLIMKGGESGHTIVAGKPLQSDLIERLLKEPGNEDHMPPKGKPQLNREQIAVLQWWVATGADFHKKVADLKPDEKIRPALLALQVGNTSKEEIEDNFPAEHVKAADAAAVSILTKSGVVITPIGRESNYLTASFVSSMNLTDTLLTTLQLLDAQLLTLNLDGTDVDDETLKKIGKLKGLRKLQLSNTKISDSGIKNIGNLVELRTLNVVGTNVTASGLLGLKELKKLDKLFLYKMKLTGGEREELRKHFPNTKIDFGNYSLPMLSTDTTLIKY